MEKSQREAAISRALDAFEQSSQKESIALTAFKDGKAGTFNVVSLPVDAVIFNPRSHRVKAQLESHPKRTIVENAPEGEEAQAVIQEVLSKTEDFEDLKGNLEEYGQTDPGVVTRDGLLVNANTRLAALRAIGPDSYIRAAVLPSNASQREVDLLELGLQMQRTFKQRYTYPNELWFIDDLFKYGFGAEEIAQRLYWAPSNDPKELKKGVARVEQSVRNWSLIRSIQTRSDGKIPLTFFDDKKQILVDLDVRFEKLKLTDSVGADRMKEIRIAGLLAECDYRHLRKLDGTTAIEDLLPELEEGDPLGPEVEALSAIAAEAPTNSDDDAALLASGAEDTALMVSFEPLVGLLTDSFGSQGVELPSGKTASRSAVIGQIVEAVETVAEVVGARNKDEKTIRGPVKALEGALNQARSAHTRYQAVGHEIGFDTGKFGYLMKKLRAQLDSIDEAVAENESRAG
jgi:hypothetical protein